MNLEELVLPVRADDASFKTAIKAITATTAAAIALMGVMVKQTFNWAKELDSLQDIMGVTNEQAAALNFTLRKSGTQTEALSRGMTILEKGLVDANGKLDTTGKSLKKWGINVFDVNGKLKDQATLIEDVSKKYASFSTQQEKVNFLTEVFGRSGAELVDFFDTLAKEGGLDKVTEKVKALGLAIDPNKYEQFSRNLEELKLIGLGMAVQFTEKVMPVLEKFLGWFTAFAQNPDPKAALHQIDNFISGIFDGMVAKVDLWLSSGGPEKLSDSVITWIDNIGKGPDTSVRSISAGQRLLDALIKAFERIDWSGIGVAIDTKTTEAINNVQWSAMGDSFGSSLAATLTGGLSAHMEIEKPNAVTAIGQGISNWFIAAAGPGNIAAFDTLEQAITQNIRNSLLGAFGRIQGQNLGNSAVFTNIGYTMVNTMTGGFAANVGMFYAQVIRFDLEVGSRLTQIAKTFFNAGGKWINQAVSGFNDHKGALFSAISNIVGEINSILKKIITSFSISIKLPSWLGGGTFNLGGSAPAKNAVGGQSGGKSPDERASGGPLISGQSYAVGERGPEMFTPKVSGRIDQITSKSEINLSFESIERIAERLGAVIPTATIKAMNSK